MSMSRQYPQQPSSIQSSQVNHWHHFNSFQATDHWQLDANRLTRDPSADSANGSSDASEDSLVSLSCTVMAPPAVVVQDFQLSPIDWSDDSGSGSGSDSDSDSGLEDGDSEVEADYRVWLHVQSSSSSTDDDGPV